MESNWQARIQRLEGVEEIRGLKAHYCDLCDAGYDPDALSNLFTEDAVWDGGSLGEFIGRERIHRFFQHMPNAMSFAVHHITNSHVQVDDSGTRGKGRWYLLQAATTASSNQALWLSGQYSDEFTKVEGEWKFSRISISTRFVTPYKSGWADTPFMELS